VRSGPIRSLTLALMCAKNLVNVFGSFLDIRQNVEWPRLLARPVDDVTLQDIILYLHITY